MKKTVFIVVIFALFLMSCDKKKTTELSSGEENATDNATIVSPEINPRQSLENIGFWNKQYFSLDYNPLYGYCYQHLFPTMDTSQEQGVIAFHISSLLNPMVIFIMDKVAYNNNRYELSGKIDDKPITLYIKQVDEKTINVMLAEYNINESFDLSSGIAYSSFIDATYNNQEEPIFDITAYDTCEELDSKIISDISDKLIDENTKELHGINVKTDKGYDCWGKWSNIKDMNNVYYELNKEKLHFIDYSEKIYATGNTRVIKIYDMTYKNGIFYFNFEDNELIGHMCIPIDNNTSMWVLDDINLGIFKHIE